MAKQLARKSVLSMINHLAINLFNMIALIFVTRWMGYEAVGMLAFSMSFCALFNIFGDLGFGLTHAKKIGEGHDPALCYGTLIAIKLYLTVFMALVIVSYLTIQKFIFGYKFESQELEIMVFLIIIQHLILNIAMIYNNIFSANLEIAKGQTPRVIMRFSTMIMKIFIVIFGLSVIFLAGAELIGTIIYLSIFIIFFKGYPVKRPTKAMMKQYAVFAFPITFIGWVAILAINMDKVMLGYFFGTEEVGIYTVPQRITEAMLILSTTIAGFYFRVFAELHEKKQFKKIQILSNKAEKYISTFILPPIIIIMIFAAPILTTIFGDDSGPSVPLIRIMVITVFIQATMNPYNIQIIAAGKLKLSLKLSVLTLVMNIILNVVFIPKSLFGVPFLGMGAQGAAYATLISLSMRSLLARIYAFRLTQSKPNRRVALHIMSAIITTGIVYCIYHAFEYHWILLIIYSLMIITIYLFIMRVVGEFTNNDIEFFLNATHPGKMKAYIVEEIKE